MHVGNTHQPECITTHILVVINEKLEQIAAESFAILNDDNYAGEHIAELVKRGGSPGGLR